MAKFVRKTVVVGDGGVGKSSVISRFSDVALKGHYKGHYKMTVGADIFSKKVELLNGDIVSLPIWDIGGQRRFDVIHEKESEKKRSQMIHCYDGVACLIMVYDTTKTETMESLFDRWLPEVFERLNKKGYRMPGIAVFANKVDQPSASSCAFDLKKLKKKLEDELSWKQIDYYRTSAITDQQVRAAFTLTAAKTCYSKVSFEELKKNLIPPKYEELTPIKLSKMIGSLSEKPIKEGESETPFNQVITSDVADIILQYDSGGFGFGETGDTDKSSKAQICQKIASLDKGEISTFFSKETYNNLILRGGWLVEGEYMLYK